MDCPNCKRKMRKENNNYHCVRCGFMSNGNHINTNDRKETNLQKYLDKEFETINYNKNFFIPFLFGPLYLTYKGCVFAGTLLLGLDIFLYISIGMLTSSRLLIYLVLITLRIIYTICANEIYITHCKNKIKKDIEENGVLTKQAHSSILYPIFSIGLYLGVALIILILYKYHIIPHDII